MNIARVGILGTGKAEQALGHGFAALGHEVKLGSRDATKIVVIAGDDPDAKATLSAICKAFGWGVADLGGIEASRWLEPMCLVWATNAMASSGTGHEFKLLRK
jgi:predicted dinucleotide-binding enzyme